MKKSVVLFGVIFSVLFLVSISFVSAGFWQDFQDWLNGPQLSPVDCSDGCKIIERKKIVVEGYGINYEIYVRSIRFDVRNRDFGARLRIKSLDSGESGYIDVVKGQKLDFIRDTHFVIDEIYQGSGKDYVAITYYLTPPAQTCEDTDGGKDYQTKGKVTTVGDGSVIIEGIDTGVDYCTSGGDDPALLSEYYCRGLDKNSLGRTFVLCEDVLPGTMCVDGACVRAESNAKEIREGTFKEINGLWVYVESATATDDLRISAGLIIGKKIELNSDNPSVMINLDGVEYKIELVSAGDDSAVIKVTK